MYQYVLAPESMPNFIEEEMYEEYWWPAGVELVLILDRGGQLKWGLLTEAGGGSTLTLDEVVLPLFTGNPLLSSPASVHSHIRGLLDTQVGLLMIVSAPITRDGTVSHDTIGTCTYRCRAVWKCGALLAESAPGKPGPSADSDDTVVIYRQTLDKAGLPPTKT